MKNSIYTITNITIFSLCIFLIFACKTKALPYEIGIENCKENKETLHAFDPVLKDSFEFEMIVDSCIEGYLLPDFSGQTIEGKTVSTASLEGKISIITFWFENCPPCIAEIPGFNQIKTKYGTDKINYLAIGNDSKKDIEKFIHRMPFNFEHVADGEEIYRNVFKSPWGYPFTIISNSKNVIIKSFGGGTTDSTAVPQLIEKIEAVLVKENINAID